MNHLMQFSSSLQGYLAVGAILFSLGIFCVLTRKNTIGILLGIELILNAAGINFVAFSKFRTGLIDGQIGGLRISALPRTRDSAYVLPNFVEYNNGVIKGIAKNRQETDHRRWSNLKPDKSINAYCDENVMNHSNNRRNRHLGLECQGKINHDADKEGNESLESFARNFISP